MAGEFIAERMRVCVCMCLYYGPSKRCTYRQDASKGELVLSWHHLLCVGRQGHLDTEELPAQRCTHTRRYAQHASGTADDWRCARLESGRRCDRSRTACPSSDAYHRATPTPRARCRTSCPHAAPPSSRLHSLLSARRVRAEKTDLTPSEPVVSETWSSEAIFTSAQH